MKAFKKFFALLLALLMTVSLLATTAMAEGENNITITNAPDGHTYAAYQIFSGSVAGGIVSNLGWGNAIPEDQRDDFISALKTDKILEKYFPSTFADNASAKEIGDVIDDWSYNEDNIQAFADVVSKFANTNPATGIFSNGNYVISISNPGYYLVMDTTANDNNNKIEGITDYLLLVSGSSAAIKHGLPTFNMSVNYREDGTYHDYLDVEVGAPVYIKLEGSLPELYEDYRQYFLCYEITLPEGLIFDLQYAEADLNHENPIINSFIEDIYLLRGNQELSLLGDTDEFTIKFNDNKQTLHFGFGNVHDEERDDNGNIVGNDIDTDDKLIVKVKAYLNPESNNLKFGKGGEGVDNLGNEITAKMTYSSDMNEFEDGFTSTFDNHWTGHFKYSEIDDVASVYTYQIEFQKQSSADNTPLANATFRMIRTDGTNSYYAVFTKTNDIYRITDWEQKTDTAPSDSTLLKSSSDSSKLGYFTVQGMDAQTYFLEEVDAPDGYNKMTQPVTVTITSGVTDRNLTTLHAVVDSNTVQGNCNTGLIATAPIYNTPGNTLPATGGMGTTIFYIVGGVLVLGAAAAFVMKRRNEA